MSILVISPSFTQLGKMEIQLLLEKKHLKFWRLGDGEIYLTAHVEIRSSSKNLSPCSPQFLTLKKWTVK